MPAFAASIDFLFRDETKAGAIRRASAVGFLGIEVGHLTQGQLIEVRDAARNDVVQIVLIRLGLGDLEVGGAGYMGVPGQRAVVEHEVRHALRCAAVLGCRRLSMPPSRVPEGVSRNTCLAALVDHLVCAADLAASEGVEVLIEPLNSTDWPGFLIASTADALGAIKAANRNNVGLQLDLYHAAMQGESPIEGIRRSIPYLRHVQFADVPGRHEPGTGTLALKDAFSLLDDLGYSGWAGAEYIPSQSTDQSFSWLDEMRPA